MPAGCERRRGRPRRDDHARSRTGSPCSPGTPVSRADRDPAGQRAVRGRPTRASIDLAGRLEPGGDGARRRDLAGRAHHGRHHAGPAASRWNLFDGGDPLDPSRVDQARPPQGLLGRTSTSSAGPRGVFMVERTTARLRQDLADTPPLVLRSFDLKRKRWSRRAAASRRPRRPVRPDPRRQDASRAAARRSPSVHERGLPPVQPHGPEATVRFGKTNVLVRRALPIADPELAVAPDGGGAAVWHESRPHHRRDARPGLAPLQAAKGKYRPRRRGTPQVCR